MDLAVVALQVVEMEVTDQTLPQELQTLAVVAVVADQVTQSFVQVVQVVQVTQQLLIGVNYGTTLRIS
jgi:hypothetical protein